MSKDLDKWDRDNEEALKDYHGEQSGSDQSTQSGSDQKGGSK